MTLHFEETTPGVHMAMWENPNSGNARTVVVIESLGQFTLYIDGDVAARDLESFEAAVARAQSTLTSGGSRRMVQMASALVVFAAVGGAAIGVTHLMSGASGIASAVTAETQAIVKDVTGSAKKVAETQFTTFKRVKPRNQPIVVSSIEPTSTSAAVSNETPVESVAINSTIPARTDQAEARIESSPSNVKAPVEPAGPRVFSATRPVFSGQPEKQPEAEITVKTVSPVVTESSTLAVSNNTRSDQPTAVANQALWLTVASGPDGLRLGCLSIADCCIRPLRH